MNLAAGLLFGIWVSIVMFVIGGWAFMEITKQDKSLYSGILDDDDVDSIR